jgi:hypothetical protein
LVIQALKRIAGRESPAQATAPGGRWRPFPNLKTYQHHQSRYYAFPSGHIATTMAALTVLAENYPENSWIRPVGYSAVGLVGLGLVGKGWHWYSDLPLGIAIGHAMGEIVAKHGGLDSPHDLHETKLSVGPMLDDHGTGIQISYRL